MFDFAYELHDHGLAIYICTIYALLLERTADSKKNAPIDTRSKANDYISCMYLPFRLASTISQPNIQFYSQPSSSSSRTSAQPLYHGKLLLLLISTRPLSVHDTRGQQWNKHVGESLKEGESMK